MESARAAGYRGSDRSLAVMGHRLYRRPRVTEAIRRKLDACEGTADRIREELAHVAFAGGREAGEALEAPKGIALGTFPTTSRRPFGFGL